ncbi:MAG: DUF4375 domain-containing protein [Gemmatimonadaceae bacterium]
MPTKRSLKKSASAAPRGTPKAAATDLEHILADSGARGGRADWGVLTALTEWAWAVPGRKAIPFADVPDGARMLILMNELVSALNSSGLLYLADWELGNDYGDIRQCTETIGAHMTMAYLDEFAALFPRNRVPVDRDARSAALERREARDAKKGLSPIVTIDQRYREAALDEIPVRVRDYVRNNKLRFEAETSAAAAQPAGSSPDDLLLDERDFITFNEGLLARYGADAAYVLPRTSARAQVTSFR